jgi:hypothetical protein
MILFSQSDALDRLREPLLLFAGTGFGGSRFLIIYGGIVGAFVCTICSGKPLDTPLGRPQDTYPILKYNNRTSFLLLSSLQFLRPGLAPGSPRGERLAAAGRSRYETIAWRGDSALLQEFCPWQDPPHPPARLS